MEQMIYGMSAPHIRGRLSTEKIMGAFMLALLPAGIHGVWRYGWNAGIVILATCVSAVLTEVVFQKIAKKPVTVKDGRGLLTALIMAYCLPPSIDWYLGVFAGVFCTLLMQLSLHYFRRNVVSPIIATRLLMMYAFSSKMFTYVFDGLTMATPLSALKQNGEVNTLFMILGKTGGCIGESSTILLCLGAIFLILKGVMDFRVTGMYLLSFAGFMTVFGGHGLSSYYLTAHMAGGGFMLTLWFIAPAFSTLPITKGGRWLYGTVLGLLTGFFRLFGPAAENICFAVLIANLCVPFIEKITIRRPFGIEKGQL
ncbi:MAG: RnfABCDGE type electron transport complex subunit D [Lachnospiraceae bacterium]|nr:RnfABCDGE type electron transport complex subunit D [Lachnospiraceae bacterium]